MVAQGGREGGREGEEGGKGGKGGRREGRGERGRDGGRDSYKAKIEESEKAGSSRESNPGHRLITSKFIYFQRQARCSEDLE